MRLVTVERERFFARKLALRALMGLGAKQDLPPAAAIHALADRPGAPSRSTTCARRRPPPWSSGAGCHGGRRPEIRDRPSRDETDCFSVDPQRVRVRWGSLMERKNVPR